MAKKPKPEPDDKEQSKRFVEIAMSIEADKTGEAFTKAFSILIKPATKRGRKKNTVIP